MSLQNYLSDAFSTALELEQECESTNTAHYLLSYSPKRLAASGLAILNLSITNIKSTLGGKTSVELSLDSAFCQPGDDIQVGSFKVGDIVKLQRMGVTNTTQDEFVEAVVTRLNSSCIAVSVDEDTSDDYLLSLYNNTANDMNRMWIVKLANSVVYKRMLQAMVKLKLLKDNEKTEILQILLGEKMLHPRQNDHPKLQFWNDKLNDSQKQAIEFSVFSSPITIIHGPPGTGKTYTLIELIKQLKFTYGEKVLVCGASNMSVDNILERLSPSFDPSPGNLTQKKSRRKLGSSSRASPEQLIRIGHPARLLPSSLRHSLDILSKTGSTTESNDNMSVLKDISNDIKDTLSSIKKCKRYAERRALWAELKHLRRELRERERKITQLLITNADVVLSTLHGAGSNELYNLYKTHDYSVETPLFDTIIIDEVSQSMEPQCWIPLINHLGCKRLVIAGDNLQLPPTVESSKRARALMEKGELIADLEQTLFDRLVSRHNGEDYKKLLNVQYRMNKDIMDFPSRELYGGLLTAGDAVQSILLSDLDGVDSTDDTNTPCVWYDTQGGDYPERLVENDTHLSSTSALGGSKYNDMEALVVRDHIRKLTSAGLAPEMIGVISPYSAQVAAVKKLLAKDFDGKVEVSTIDGFQGREKEAIIVSLVRLNDRKEIGFLSDSRRLNVAMTRPKRHLCIIGDMELLSESNVPYLKNWASHADESFEVRYPNITDF